MAWGQRLAEGGGTKHPGPWGEDSQAEARDENWPGEVEESPGLVRLAQSGVGGRNGERGEADRPAMRMSPVPGVKWGAVQGFELREAGSDLLLTTLAAV